MHIGPCWSYSLCPDDDGQPGQLQEMMLHETAVAWMRLRLSKTKPREPWTETREQYGTRLKEIAAYINAEYDVPLP